MNYLKRAFHNMWDTLTSGYGPANPLDPSSYPQALPFTSSDLQQAIDLAAGHVARGDDNAAAALMTQMADYLHALPPHPYGTDPAAAEAKQQFLRQYQDGQLPGGADSRFQKYWKLLPAFTVLDPKDVDKGTRYKTGERLQTLDGRSVKAKMGTDEETIGRFAHTVAGLQGRAIAPTPEENKSKTTQPARQKGPVALAGIPQTMPLNAKVGSRFGYRVHPIYKKKKFHAGVDLSIANGTPVPIGAGGKVEFSGWKGGYGNTVIVDHGNNVTTLYAHLSKRTVIAGQTLKPGEILGNVGSTGVSTAPHLHYEIRLNGKPIDPQARQYWE